ncbi:hypothetical protein [Streptomyces sp. 8N706]|uniref:hypothetical protein n=1 Tax=Streptomyces sp. 8N706 TaxID=3457416 RepID=UPI003FD117F4
MAPPKAQSWGSAGRTVEPEETAGRTPEGHPPTQVDVQLDQLGAYAAAPPPPPRCAAPVFPARPG